VNYRGDPRHCLDSGRVQSGDLSATQDVQRVANNVFFTVKRLVIG
jgi:hypothetical protein